MFWTKFFMQHLADLRGEPAGHPHLCGVASSFEMLKDWLSSHRPLHQLNNRFASQSASFSTVAGHLKSQNLPDGKQGHLDQEPVSKF